MNVCDCNAAIGTKDKAMRPKTIPFNSIGNAARLVLLCAISQFATAQVKHGTVIMWMATDTDFVLTADSRGSPISWRVAPSYPDDECKILTFDNNLVFAAAGVIANNRGLLWPGWDIKQIATALAQGSAIHASADIDILADNWARRVQGVINEDFALSKFGTDGPIIQAVFAGAVGVPKRIHAVEVYLTLGAKPEIKRFDPGASGSALLRVYGTGNDLILQYLMAHGTEAPAGKHSAEKIERSVDDLIRSTYTITGFAVEQSGAFGTVGGPIDQVHLSRKGVEWVHQKPNCQETTAGR